MSLELWEVGRAAGNFLLYMAGPPPAPSQGGEWILESDNLSGNQGGVPSPWGRVREGYEFGVMNF